jgi:hypothetical protein
MQDLHLHCIGSNISESVEHMRKVLNWEFLGRGVPIINHPIYRVRRTRREKRVRCIPITMLGIRYLVPISAVVQVDTYLNGARSGRYLGTTSVFGI